MSETKHNPLKRIKNAWNSIFSTDQQQSTDQLVVPENPQPILTELQSEEHRLYDLMMKGKISEDQFKIRAARAKIVKGGAAKHIPNEGVKGGTGPVNPDGSGRMAKDR